MLQRIRADIQHVLARDPAARSPWEVLTCYPGLHALWLHRCAHALWRRGWHWPGRFVSHLGRWLTGVEIHPGACIGNGVFIDHGMGVVIGETAVVGEGCTIYQGVTLGGTSLYKGAKRHPTLGPGVIVGAGAKILGGFEVGAGARIGSNAVVVRPVPPGATVVGIPARVVGQEQAPSAPQAGFSPYGVTREEDPVNLLMRDLNEKTDAHEQEIARLWQALERLAATGGDDSFPGRGACNTKGSAEQI